MCARALRLGIVGFGRLAREYYLPALREIAAADVVAVADPLAASREAAAARLPGVRVHVAHRAMLDHEPLDGVLIASPPSTHLAVWDDVAARGPAVFLEKPFVLSGQLGELERRRASDRVMMDFNRRFWPPYRRVIRLVQGGAVGRPFEAEYLLHVNVLAWCTVTSHRLAPGEGGVLHDLGSQAIDLALDLLGGEPVAVAAEARTRRWAGDRLHLRLASADGSVVRSDLAYGERTREQLVVRGPRGVVRLADPNMAVHRGAGGIGARCQDAAAFAYRALRPGHAFARASIRAALDRFVRATRGEATFVPGFEDGRRNARWVAAAAATVRGAP
jgi:scyllo-inositol 2-dehydrogenase (NADP+)